MAPRIEARSQRGIAQRKAAVRARLSIGAVVESHVKLSGSAGSKNRRGKCPFHGSNSPSFAVFDAHSGDGGAHCFGCQWHGDIFDFVADIRGVGFMDALSELEGLAGLGRATVAQGLGPVHRARNPAQRKLSEYVEPIEQGRWIWRHAVRDDAAIARYFAGRGVPSAVLTPDRLAAFRYLAECPCTGWREGEDPRQVIHAPAIMALMVRAERGEAGEVGFTPQGLHVTYLSPGGDGTMKRCKPWAKEGDPDPWLPKRRMLGPAGGAAVVLGSYDPAVRLWVGEGNETVLSAMGLGNAAPGDCGIAVLSLDNLQGAPKLWKDRTWPLFRIEGDPERAPFVIGGHRGAVIGLIDADMAPLKGKRGRDTGAFLGENVVERKGGPIMRRAITGAERARICADLFAQAWRRAGAVRVEARRPPLGMDFNDLAESVA